MGTRCSLRAVIALGYRLDDRGSKIRFSTGAGNFSLHLRVQNGSGSHPATYPMGTRGSFPGGTGREADHSPPSSAEVEEWVELYLHSPNTPSWRGAQLKYRDNFTFYLYLPCTMELLAIVIVVSIRTFQTEIPYDMECFAVGHTIRGWEANTRNVVTAYSEGKMPRSTCCGTTHVLFKRCTHLITERRGVQPAVTPLCHRHKTHARFEVPTAHADQWRILITRAYPKVSGLSR
jgi:hypothetical protein